MIKNILLLVLFLLSASIHAKSFCGNLVDVKGGDTDTLNVSSIVLKNNKVKDNPSTPWKDNYLRVTNRKVFWTIEKKADLKKGRLSYYVFGNNNIKKDKIFLCVDNITTYTRKKNGKVTLYSKEVSKMRMWQNGKDPIFTGIPTDSWPADQKLTLDQVFSKTNEYYKSIVPDFADYDESFHLLDLTKANLNTKLEELVMAEANSSTKWNIITFFKNKEFTCDDITLCQYQVGEYGFEYEISSYYKVTAIDKIGYIAVYYGNGGEWGRETVDVLIFYLDYKGNIIKSNKVELIF